MSSRNEPLGTQTNQFDIDVCTILACPSATAGARAACSTALMSARNGRLEAADMMKVLRNHGHGEHYHLQWNIDCATKFRTVCMHAGAEDRPGQTVGSMVSELRARDAVHWVTGTAAPRISIFKTRALAGQFPKWRRSGS